jgi:hypothetical protein
MMTPHISTCKEDQVDEEDEVVQERAKDFLAFFCDQCNTEKSSSFQSVA